MSFIPKIYCTTIGLIIWFQTTTASYTIRIAGSITLSIRIHANSNLRHKKNRLRTIGYLYMVSPRGCDLIPHIRQITDRRFLSRIQYVTRSYSDFSGLQLHYNQPRGKRSRSRINLSPLCLRQSGAAALRLKRGWRYDLANTARAARRIYTQKRRCIRALRAHCVGVQHPLADSARGR